MKTVLKEKKVYFLLKYKKYLEELPVPKAGSMTMVSYCDWLASKLAWPEPNRESMRYCQEEDEKHQTSAGRYTGVYFS